MALVSLRHCFHQATRADPLKSGDEVCREVATSGRDPALVGAFHSSWPPSRNGQPWPWPFWWQAHGPAPTRVFPGIWQPGTHGSAPMGSFPSAQRQGHEGFFQYLGTSIRGPAPIESFPIFRLQVRDPMK